MEETGEYKIIGLRFSIPELAEANAVLRVRVVYGKLNEKDCVLLSLEPGPQDGFAIDLQGRRYRYEGGLCDSKLPPFYLGHFDEKERNPPEEGCYLAVMRKHPQYKIHLVQFEPQFPTDNWILTDEKIYFRLLEQIAEEYQLEGLPNSVSELFSQSLYKKIQIEETVPNSPFIDCKQRPMKNGFSFSPCQTLTTPGSKEIGPTVVLKNQDFILTVGRCLDKKAIPEYGMLLQRRFSGDEKLRIYTMQDIVYNCIYHDIPPIMARFETKRFLDELQELVILAFYRDQYSDVLFKYWQSHNLIIDYLQRRIFTHTFKINTIDVIPITCWKCDAAKFVEYERYTKKAPYRWVCNTCGQEYYDKLHGEK